MPLQGWPLGSLIFTVADVYDVTTVQWSGQILPQITARDLTSLNTLGLRSCTEAFVTYDAVDQLPELSRLVSRYANVFVLGAGSNVLLGGNLQSLVIKIMPCDVHDGVHVRAETDLELVIEAQAGVIWHDFVQLCVGRGWNGLENLALIPGTVGAAPVQNIGAYGVELDQRFHSLVAWDLREQRLTEMGPADCRFAYRDSLFKRSGPGRWLIVSVRFRLPKSWHAVLTYPDLLRHPVLANAGAAATAADIFSAVCDIRRSKLPDPKVLGNAGSFFKNPVVAVSDYNAIIVRHPGLVAYPDGAGHYKLAAGWLIDRAGWKGRRMGRVGVHDRQALVLVNYGGANATDIAALADAIRHDVMLHFGVALEQEPVTVS